MKLNWNHVTEIAIAILVAEAVIFVFKRDS